MIIFSIRNDVTKRFNRPIYCESTDEALSLVMNDIASDSTGALEKLSTDLSLFALGDINFDTGFIIPHVDCPVFVCKLSEIRSFYDNLEVVNDEK